MVSASGFSLVLYVREFLQSPEILMGVLLISFFLTVPFGGSSTVRLQILCIYLYFVLLFSST